MQRLGGSDVHGGLFCHVRRLTRHIERLIGITSVAEELTPGEQGRGLHGGHPGVDGRHAAAGNGRDGVVSSCGSLCRFRGSPGSIAPQ